MDDIKLLELKIISHPKGDLFHIIRKSSEGYIGFGEAYISSINYNDIKGWKKHNEMTLNLVVLSGEIQIVITDEINFKSFNLSLMNYKRLVVPPGFWMAFKGVSKGNNLLVNIANIEHNPFESESIEINHFNYNW
uniref:WxcM-like domain-containing protein n=1 Tax=Flavobacterium sp. TaxID=239 RepID=UPI004049046D